MPGVIRKRVLNILQNLYFKGRLFVNDKMRLPAQTRQEIGIFKAVFDGVARSGFNEEEGIKIFEWGSGFSTLYYASYLEKKGIRFEWHSIDNNRLWHERVMACVRNACLDSKVTLHLMEFEPFWEKAGWGPVPPPCGVFVPKTENEKDYVQFPKKLNKKFNLSIIDARFRRHCVQIAREILSPGGVVVLHDAQKPHYHIGLDQFRYSIFLESGKWYPYQNKPNKVWVGFNEASDLTYRLVDSLKKYSGNG